jgi:hypothetical protein
MENSESKGEANRVLLKKIVANGIGWWFSIHMMHLSRSCGRRFRHISDRCRWSTKEQFFWRNFTYHAINQVRLNSIETVPEASLKSRWDEWAVGSVYRAVGSDTIGAATMVARD